MAATATVTDDIEFRSVSLNSFEKRLDDDSDIGTFEGYACRYGIVDSYGTTFAPRCWASGGLDDGTYALLSMHDERHVVGAFTAQETDQGLYIRGRYDDTPEGHAARARAKSGSAGELSVGFIRTGVDPTDPDRITGARLYEVSQITARMASQPRAALSMVRAVVDKRVDDAEKETADFKKVAEKQEEKTEILEDAGLNAEFQSDPNTQQEDFQTTGGEAATDEERSTKPACRSCGKNVRKFICSRCLQSGIKGGNIASEERMDLPEELRVYSQIAGSFEDRTRRLRESLVPWASRQYAVQPNDLYVSIEATFNESVVFSVESWSDDAPSVLSDGTGEIWRVAYVINEDQEITLGEPVKAELVTVVREDVPTLEIRTEETPVMPEQTTETTETTKTVETTEPETPVTQVEEPTTQEPVTPATEVETADGENADSNGAQATEEPNVAEETQIAQEETQSTAEEPASAEPEVAQLDEERARRLKLRLRLLNQAS